MRIDEERSDELRKALLACIVAVDNSALRHVDNVADAKSASVCFFLTASTTPFLLLATLTTAASPLFEGKKEMPEFVGGETKRGRPEKEPQRVYSPGGRWLKGWEGGRTFEEGMAFPGLK